MSTGTPSRSARSRTRRRARALVASTAAVAGLLVGASAALADTEPNDHLYMAEGPIAGGQQLSGSLPKGDNADYYVLYVSGIQQLHLTANAITGSESCVRRTLLDSDGDSIGTDVTTPAGVSRYYVRILRNCDPDIAYTFRVDPAPGVDPATAIVSGPGKLPLTPLTEPNEDPTQAIGPLTPGTWYAGALETQNDQDWMYFYTAPGTHQLDVQTTSQTGSDCGTYFSLRSETAPDERVDGGSAYVGAERISHMSLTVTGPAKHYLTIGDHLGCSYLVQVGPPDAITASPPASFAPPPVVAPPVFTPPVTKPTSRKSSTKCRESKASRTRWNKRIASTKRSIKRTRSSTRKRALQKKLSAERRTLKRVKDRVTIYC